MGESEGQELAKTDGQVSEPGTLSRRKEPIPPNHQNPRFLRSIGVGAIFVFCGVNYLMAIAGLWTGYHWLTVPVIASAARGQVVAAIVGLVSGFIALITFTVNYHQKNYIQEKANFTAEQIADDNRRQQNKWEEDRLRTQQVHFDRQRAQERAQAEYDSIANEYDALSKDFVAEQELARINAAIGLAAIAMRPDPRRLFNEEISKPEDAPKTRDYYPWYERVASQLAAALITYERASERAQVRNSIELMGGLERTPGQPLLHFLIEQLVKSNRTAFEDLLGCLARAVHHGSPTIKTAIAQQLMVFERGYMHDEFLDELISSEKFITASRQVGADVDSAKNSVKDHLLIEKTIEACRRLVATRDAIADCVAARVRTAELDHLIAEKVFPFAVENAGVRRLNLSRTFLAGIDFERAELAGALFTNADLTRATLKSANLQLADFGESELRCAALYFAKLRGAMFIGTSLKATSLDESDLENAFLSHSKLDCTSFMGAKLKYAVVSEVRPSNSDFSGADPWNADINVWEYQLETKTFVRTDRMHESVQAWFKERYPGPWPEDKPAQ